MKTVALLASLDTKGAERDYAAAEFARLGLATLTIDVGTSTGYRSVADYTPADVSREVGVSWPAVAGGVQHELLDIMARGAGALVATLYARGALHGVFSFGGLQNTTIAASAMRCLPVGVPKLILSTVASGQRTFDSVVGARDIVTMPSIADLAGLNPITRVVMDNAIAAMTGMVTHAGREIPRSTSPFVGATLMGATNDGVFNAIRLVREAGYDVAGFHSTGAGGRCMEDMIAAGVVTAAMDLTLHEIVYEYFGHGFGFGAQNRLMAAIDGGIPLVVCPAGIDFICQWRDQLFADVEARKLHWHNKNLAHVRLNEAEILAVSRIIIERLNRSTGPAKVILPTRGFRNYVGLGEPLHDPGLDALIVDVFSTELRRDIPVLRIDCNLMDGVFSEAAAHEMISLIESVANA
jgi:uncharacterized protein (UPF0261 family)